jgi:hypothetical protein
MAAARKRKKPNLANREAICKLCNGKISVGEHIASNSWHPKHAACYNRYMENAYSEEYPRNEI